MKAHRKVLQKGAILLSLLVERVAYSFTSKFNVVSLCCELTNHKRNTKHKGSQIRHINLNTDISIAITDR